MSQPPNAMKPIKYLAAAHPAIAASIIGLTLAGCVGYLEPTGRTDVLVQPPVVLVDPALNVPDDYTYYPRYQVYYSSNRRQSIYRNGRSWVSQRSPPRISAEVFHAAPAVRLDVHNSPWANHSTVVRQYPRSWTPPRGRNGDSDNKGGDRH